MSAITTDEEIIDYHPDDDREEADPDCVCCLGEGCKRCNHRGWISLTEAQTQAQNGDRLWRRWAKDEENKS